MDMTVFNEQFAFLEHIDEWPGTSVSYSDMLLDNNKPVDIREKIQNIF